MTVAVVTLAAVVAIALGTVALLAIRHADALRSERASMADANLARTEKLDEQRQRETAEGERDEARARAAKAGAELASTRQRLGIATADLIRARLELTEQIRARLENGTDEQAAAIVNDLLRTPILPPKET